MASSSSSSSRTRRNTTSTSRISYLQSYLVVALGLCCLLTLVVNFRHGSYVAFLHQEQQHVFFHKNDNAEAVPHQLAGLTCDAYGGPSQDMAQEMVYWSDIPEDSQYTSPFFHKDKPRYMTFEPDGGGWNNIRMSMETVLAMAHAMGRTLVLPPEQGMYLLGNNKAKDGKEQRREFSFSDFFHMDSISQEHEGLEIISTQEFLKREALTGHLVDRTTGLPSFPPHDNRTDWNGNTHDIQHVFSPWLRSVAYPNMKDWNPQECLAAFPKSTHPQDIDALQKMVQDIDKQGWPKWESYVGKPTAVDASPKERLKENAADRTKLCLYHDEMQHDLLVHFSGKAALGGRLLVHFYAFLFFQDWKQDLWMKRFVRDHVRYVDELQCAAARVVHAIRQHAAKKKNGNNPNGDFDSFHVRRGDFQYKETRISAQELYERSKDEIPDGTTVYMATDERDKDFFQPLAQHYDLLFLDDFKHLYPDLNTNYYGMLDQLIASRGRVFFGCWFSTFTSYINRVRGYHADKLQLPGYEQGLVESYYYARPEDKYRMREFYPVKKTFHSREYPASWRGIDKGIGLLHN